MTITITYLFIYYGSLYFQHRDLFTDTKTCWINLRYNLYRIQTCVQAHFAMRQFIRRWQWAFCHGTLIEAKSNQVQAHDNRSKNQPTKVVIVKRSEKWLIVPLLCSSLLFQNYSPLFNVKCRNSVILLFYNGQNTKKSQVKGLGTETRKTAMIWAQLRT